MGEIRKTKSGEWILTYTCAAGSTVEICTSAPKNDAEAEMLLHHCELQAIAVRFSGLPLPPPAEPWRLIWGWWKSACLPRYSAEWQRTLVHICEKYLLPLIGKFCPGEIRPLEIKNALTRLVLDKTLTPSSANAIRSIGAAVVADAMLDRRWPPVVGNPFRMFSPFKIGRRIWPTLTAEESAKLILGTTGRRRALWALALYMGLRRGELWALRASDFDLKRRSLVVARSHERETTKNGNARQIPIVDELMPLIEPHISAIPDGGLLFPGKSGKMLSRSHHLPRNLHADLAASGVVVAWEEKCRCGWRFSTPAASGRPEPRRCPECGKKAWTVGIPPDIRGHDLRHTFATLATEAGVSPDVVRLTLGHSGGITSVYQHISLEAMRRELSRLSIVPLAS